MRQGAHADEVHAGPRDVADPLEDSPRFEQRIYWLPIARVINAILLGVLTYDANLLILEPPEKP